MQSCINYIKLVSLLIADRLLCSCDPTQSDSSLEKFGSFFGINSVDHDADVVDQTAIVKVDSPETAMVWYSPLHMYTTVLYRGCPHSMHMLL